MNRIKGHHAKAALAIAIIASIALLGAPPAFAAAIFILNIEPLEKALKEHTGALQKFIESSNAQWKGHADRLIELEQKLDKRAGGSDFSSGLASGALTAAFMKSGALEQFKAGSPSGRFDIPPAMMKAAILNATGQNQPLVAADRNPGIVAPVQRRFFIRDLLLNIPTESNSIEFTKENVFTNNAGAQGGTTSPTVAGGEGEIKNESGITFTLTSTPVITLAHWIPASRQVLSDAPMLQAYVEQRLLYGLKLEEEDEILNGAGLNGELTGLVSNATAFNRGATNMTALDAVANGIGQLIASDYMPTVIVLSALDWFSTKFLLAKTSQGEYLLGNPAQLAAEQTLFGLPVVVTNAMASGSFMVLDAPRVGYVADREQASIRVSEHHEQYFVKNLIAILCEERLALVVQRSGAIVYGSLTY